MINQLKISVILSATLFASSAFGQIGVNQLNGSGKNDNLRINTITTAMPFLSIAADSRSGAMGDIGVATSADQNSIAFNASKLAFVEDEFGMGVSYTPWLKNLVNDISLSYVSFYKRIDRRQTFGGSMRYFTLGNIQFTDEFGQNIQSFNPNEFALDGAYALKFSDQLSGGVALRYAYSNLTGGINVGGSSTKPAQTVAFDISGYYENDKIEISNKDVTIAAGANISNIGAKVRYSNSNKQDFIPINLRLGPRATVELDQYNKISLAVEFNKLMVPTSPLYLYDTKGQVIIDQNGTPAIGAGTSQDKALASGFFGSFSDAPGVVETDDQGNALYNDDGTYQIVKGSVFKEEMREITIGTGLEYWYDNQFAVRAGYFHEHITKGNRKFFTMGIGLKYNVLGFDFSYLVPVYTNNSGIVANSPLKNTLRFTLSFDFSAFKDESSDS